MLPSPKSINYIFETVIKETTDDWVKLDGDLVSQRLHDTAFSFDMAFGWVKDLDIDIVVGTAYRSR
jgi:hypothetical protein